MDLLIGVFSQVALSLGLRIPLTSTYVETVASEQNFIHASIMQKFPPPEDEKLEVPKPR